MVDMMEIEERHFLFFTYFVPDHPDFVDFWEVETVWGVGVGRSKEGGLSVVLLIVLKYKLVEWVLIGPKKEGFPLYSW